MTPTLSKDEVTSGLIGEYRRWRELLERLSGDDLRTPTRCAGWEVRDVAGHVVGLASDSFGGRIGQFTGDEQAAQRRDHSASQLLRELDEALAVAEPFAQNISDEDWEGPSGAPGLTLARGALTLWYDAWLHRDDVRSALGEPPDRDEGLRASVVYLQQHLAEDGWQPPDGVDLDSLDPHAFVLAATGRSDPAELGLDPEVNIYR